MGGTNDLDDEHRSDLWVCILIWKPEKPMGVGLLSLFHGVFFLDLPIT